MNQLGQKTLSRLKEAISRKGDLPSMTATLTKIVSSMKDAEDNDDRLVQAVLSDVALTQKVLRLANSSMYSAFGGSVTTVSKAIFILGTETVGHLALGLKLLDNFGQAADSETSQRELGMAVMSGVVARKLGNNLSGTSGEEVAVAALLRCTGRLLVCFYLPDDFKILRAKNGDVDAEDELARETLGLSYGDIARCMAEAWNLPEELSSCMDDAQGNVSDHKAWVQAVAGYSRRYVSAVSNGADNDQISALAQRYAEAVGRPASELVSVACEAFEESEEAAARQAVVPKPVVATPQVQQKDAADPARTVLQKLVAGVAEAQSMESSMKPPQVTSMVAEILWDAFACTRVMFFLRRPSHKCFELMVGFGEGVQDKLHQVRFEEAFSPNVFHVALSNATSVYLANTRDPNIARRIPQWLQESFGVSKSLFLIPISVDKVSAGLLCLDWGPQGRQVPLSPAETTYVESLRSLIERSFSAARARAASAPAVVANTRAARAAA